MSAYEKLAALDREIFRPAGWTMSQYNEYVRVHRLGGFSDVQIASAIAVNDQPVVEVVIAENAVDASTARVAVKDKRRG